MKRYRGWMILLLCVALFTGGVRLVLWATADYPTLGEPVSFPVNQVEGFDLTIQEPFWSPFKGYTIRWSVSAESEEIYTFVSDGPDFEYLERCIGRQWYRLAYSQENLPFNQLEFALGGETSSLSGSMVQKYMYYGTRLETGSYRLVLEMRAEDGTPCYLAAEFDVR